MDQNTKSLQAGGDTRRSFIKKAAAAAAVVAASNPFKTPVYGQTQAPSPGRVIGANDRIVLGFIGVGGQGTNAHVGEATNHASANNTVSAAVCDVSKTRVEQAKKRAGGSDVEGFKDHRKLLERKDIDAVFIATVDHWHTVCAIDALNAGKHVYVEKPMTRYLDEAFAIYDTVKRTGKLLTVGSQGCSDMKWHRAAELIKAGKLGTLVMGQSSYMRNNPKGEWNYGIAPWCTPEDLDWAHWLGPIHKKIDFSADHYFRWRKYYPYCAGLLGDLLPHRLHPFMLATGNPEFPTRVTSLGNKKVGSDRNTPNTYERDVPETVTLLAEFPSGMTLVMCSSSVNEQGFRDMIQGHMGNLNMSGNRVELRPERPFSEEIDGETIGIDPSQGESVANHHRNFFQCIRTGKQPNANIDLAVKVQTVISLSEMSERLNVTCVFDEKTRSVTTADGKPIKSLTYGSLPLS
jgi:predicted dehydrogenase